MILYCSLVLLFMLRSRDNEKRFEREAGSQDESVVVVGSWCWFGAQESQMSRI